MNAAPIAQAVGSPGGLGALFSNFKTNLGSLFGGGGGLLGGNSPMSLDQIQRNQMLAQMLMSGAIGSGNIGAALLGGMGTGLANRRANQFQAAVDAGPPVI